MLDKKWFKNHQHILLWLLNAPMISWAFRRVMCINKNSSTVGNRKIIKITPNAIFWREDKKLITGEFRTHNKYTKRLYYSFYPVWLSFHLFDILIANRINPSLNLGFDSATVYPNADPESTSVDGDVRRASVDESFSTIHDGAGTAADSTSANSTAGRIDASTTSNQYSLLIRFICLFDTSALGSGASISAATLSLYGRAKSDQLGGTQTIAITTSSPASNTTLASGDYANLGTVRQASDIAISAFSDSAYNDFTLNATGRGNISTTSITKFGSRVYADIENSAASLTWSASQSARGDIYAADQTGTTNDPKLTITYSLGITGGIIII